MESQASVCFIGRNPVLLSAEPRKQKTRRPERRGITRSGEPKENRGRKETDVQTQERRTGGRRGVQKDDASTRFAADGKWLGALRRRTYLFASIDPGEHHLCAIGRIGAWSHVSLHELNAKAGEIYYFVTEYGELVPDQFTLRQVDPDEEKHLVAWAHLSAFHTK